ncbi:MAG: aldehyde dehydrogenase family protein, partial [Allosphingosinicella sp.]
MPDLVCISPVDGKEYARRPVAADADIGAALDKARRAQRDWAGTPLAERCATVLRFLDAMTATNDAVVPELAWQMGRPVRFGGELRSLTERVGAMAELAPAALADENVGQGRRVRRVPAGLVLVIAPWNYPFLTAANTIVAALIAGNAVLHKPASQTLLAGERFAEAFAAAGLPDGLFANLFMSHDQTAHLLAAGVVDHITFTGSVEGGRAIERAAAGSFTSLTLELGGKDPAYVRADAKLDHAVENLVDGAFYNSGQCC